MAPSTRTLTDAERRQLDRSLTGVARVVAGAFVGVGLIAGVAWAALSLARGDPHSAWAGAAAVTALSGGAGLVLGTGLWLLSWPRRQQLLSAPLVAGSGTVRTLTLPTPGEGGSTVLDLVLVLPSGAVATGVVRIHGTPEPYEEGQALTLWFATPPTTFVLDDFSIRHDPGVVTR